MVIINGIIFTMEGEVIKKGYVRTKGKIIEEVGHMDSFKDNGKDEKVLDVDGAWVLPGLIEAHAHIGITEEKWGIIGDDCNETTTPVTAAMKVAFGENPKTMYGDKNQFPTTRMGTAAMLRKILYQATQYKKDKENGSLNKEIPLKAHAHRSDDILTAIRIAKEFDVDITIDHGTESHLIVDEIAESGFPVIVGPELTSKSKLEVQNMNFKTSSILHEAGVLFSIMTDHPVSMLQYLPLCVGLAVKSGLPVEEGLKAITINAARICRVDDKVGSLKKGKDADIAVFSGNPMEIFTKTLYTIINGEIIYEE